MEADVAPGAPRGVHVSFVADPRTTATVSWFTDSLVDPGSVVEFGATPALGRSAAGASHQAFGVAALVHEATLTGLDPGSTVHYRVGGASGWSETRAFRTAPDGASFRLVAIGDVGQRAQTSATLAAAAAASPDLVLLAGDLSYAEGNHAAWDSWFDVMQPLAARATTLAAPGNHDSEGAFGTQAFESRLAQPGAELYYSFDYGRAHFLVLYSHLSGAATEGRVAPMLRFMADDLEAAAARRDAGQLDFLVVVQHHPLVGSTKSGEVPLHERQIHAPLLALQEATFQRHGVDLLLTAHNHNYERSKPMVAAQPTTQERRDYVDPVGYVQVVTGGGGQSLYDFVDPNDYKSFVARAVRRYHFTQIDFAPGEMRATAIATDDGAGDVLDTWTLRRA